MLEIHSQAQNEIENIVEWYGRRSVDTAERFREQLIQWLRFIEEFPEASAMHYRKHDAESCQSFDTL